jgi:hypothetical protein
MNSKLEIYFDILFTFILILGVFGNIINIVVLREKSLANTNTFKFLFYLSIVDLLILLICASDSLATHILEFEIRIYSTITCKIHVFLTYYLTHLSSIILMVVSIERLYTIHNKKFYCCLLNTTKRFIIFIAVLLALINSHYLYFFSLNSDYRVEYNSLKIINCSNYTINANKLMEESNDNLENYLSFNKCYINDDNKININSSLTNLIDESVPFLICYPINNPTYSYFLDVIWVWVDSSLYSFIPFVVMTISSLLIIAELVKTSRRIKNKNTNKSISKNNLKRNKQILQLLVLTNFFFIFFSLPYSISNNNIVSISYQSLYFIHMLAYTNNSINIIFYYVFSTKYRSTLLDLFKSFKELFVKNNINKIPSRNQRKSLNV